jgi:Ca-activated chloride channel family protein
MPLPADGAVAGYEFRVGARRVVGEIDSRASARERFEQALVDGRTAGILNQERANLFTQEIGNVPPRTEVAVELTIDQPLTWLPEGMWEWRFPTVAAPRYLGAEGRVPDAPNVTVDVADGPTGVRASLEVAIGDTIADGRRPESPSHGLSIGSGATTRVTLSGDNGAALDRDLGADPRLGRVDPLTAAGVPRACAPHRAGVSTRKLSKCAPDLSPMAQ